MLPFFRMQAPGEHEGTHAIWLGSEGLLQIFPRFGTRPMLARLLSQFAIELRDGGALFFARHGFQAARVFDGFVPIALVLVDRNQMAQCRGRMRVHRHQVREQRFGAVEQTGAHVVFAQFQQGYGLHPFRKAGPGDQMLMQTDGSIHFTATPKQVA